MRHAYWRMWYIAQSVVIIVMAMIYTGLWMQGIKWGELFPFTVSMHLIPVLIAIVDFYIAWSDRQNPTESLISWQLATRYFVVTDGCTIILFWIADDLWGIQFSWVFLVSLIVGGWYFNRWCERVFVAVSLPKE